MRDKAGVRPRAGVVEHGGPGMRVGMIVHAYYLKDARVRRYAELLAADGHEVDVICLREPGEPRTDSHLGVRIHRVDLARTRGGRSSYVLEYASSFLRFLLKLNRLWLGGTRFDVLHIHNMPDVLVFCALFQRLWGTKVVLDVHDLMSEVYQSKYGLGGDHWLARLLRVEERLSAGFASAVITANHAFADILKDRSVPADKVTVVMNAANDRFYLSEEARKTCRAGKPEGDFHVMYIGTLAPRYGVEIAVRALARLHRSGAIPGLRFSIIPKIANEGTYLDDVLAEIDRSGLGDRFALLDPVPHDRMPEVIAGADAMIYTAIPDVHMDIALSLKIPEAIAVGCPVVSSRLSVNSRYFGDDALFVFEPGDVEECAERVLQVYREPELARAKAAAARAKLEEMAWAKQAARYRALLAGLCEEELAYGEVSQ